MGKISHSLAVKLVVNVFTCGLSKPELSELKQDPFSILETVKQGISDQLPKVPIKMMQRLRLLVKF